MRRIRLSLARVHPSQPTRATTLDWQVLDDADEQGWQTVVNAVTSRSTTPPHARPRRALWLLSTLALLAVIGIATWVTHWAGARATALERELALAVEADRWVTGRAPALSGANTAAPEQVTVVESRADHVLVDVTVPDAASGAVYRQSQVYQLTAGGWTRVAPSPELWGDSRRMESRYFVWEYYARDEQAVSEASGLLDKFVPNLARSYPNSRPRAKLEIVVSPWRDPAPPLGRIQPSGRLTVPSPALYLAPSTLNQSELLAQSIALVLLSESHQQYVRSVYAQPRDYWHGGEAQIITWYPLGYAVQLWQLWMQDLPLAVWHKPLVHWLFAGHAAVDAEVPDFLDQMCTDYAIWRTAPTVDGIPILCQAVEYGGAVYMTWRDRSIADAAVSPLRLHDLLPLTDTRIATGEVMLTNPHGLPPHPAANVALATVVEYAAATYGLDAIPRLLSNAHDHTSWDTLIPAIFGVPAAEFEAGWHAFLVEEYDVQVPPVVSEHESPRSSTLYNHPENISIARRAPIGYAMYWY